MKENLSQSKLLEVLTHEIEVLRTTTSNINAVAPIIAERLQELKQTRITANVDITALRSVLIEHKEFVKDRVTIPFWFIVAFLIVTGSLVIQSVLFYGYFFAK